MTDIEQRNQALIEAYQKKLKQHIIAGHSITHMPLKNFIHEVINSGAPRYYISIEYARRIILCMKKGENIRLGKSRKKLYEDFYQEYLKQQQKLKGYYQYAIIQQTINTPAPSFYLQTRQAMNIIWNTQKTHQK